MTSNVTSLSSFIPELVLCGTAILLMCMAAVRSVMRPAGPGVAVFESKVGFPSYVAAAGLAVSFYYAAAGWGEVKPMLFMGMLVSDHQSGFFKLLFAAAALVAVVMSRSSSELGDGEGALRSSSASFADDCEYYALMLGMVVGMDLLAGAKNLLVIYLALEFTGLMSYMLVGYARDSKRSSEAALKYVLFGAVASGIFLFGSSLLYGLYGSLNILAFTPLAQGPSAVYTIAGLLVLGGFLFKVAAVPMHAWCPDAYEGAPTPITALLSVAPKAAGFAVLIRVATLLGPAMDWPVIIAVVSAITMTLGNLTAITQTNAKRMLAYSSIAHAGYMLMAVACASAKGNEAVYFYFVAYLLMNLGAFIVVQIVGNRMGSDEISAFKGLGRLGSYGTFLGIAMTIFLLSLTGVPPFVGFIGKFYLFSAVIDARLWWLAIVGILNSVVSLYYYMRIVKAIFFDEPASSEPFVAREKGLAILIGVLALGVVTFGLLWEWIVRIANYAAY